MNKPDPFEEKLRGQPHRQLPGAWRDEILIVAREAATERAAVQPPDSFIQYWNRLLANLLWPHPAAWGALAVAWLIILVLNVASRDSADSRMASEAGPPSPELRQLLRDQEQMLAELIGPLDQAAAVEPKRRGAQPRSEARPEFVNV
jgi:hypothetical protein